MDRGGLTGMEFFHISTATRRRKMKKFLVFTLAAAVAVNIAVPVAWAQDSATDEFTLEEIMVTAEKREVNVQTVPASVQALPGDDLVLQGKATAAQMLENVPNVTYGEGGRNGSPNDNITIRGVKRTQEPGGGSPVPSSTSTYVDGVFEGIGGNYDINRIEVLRGPQGTLYGRSATGGVVAFHTNNPKLEEFEGNVLVEYGSGDRINTQGAVNVPLGDKFALRFAAHYLHQKEGYFNNDKGGENKTTEGRIKALYQPSENLSFLLSFSAAEAESYSGGYSMGLTAPNTIDYKASYFEPNVGDPTKYKQGSLEINYDLAGSALTYIAAIHSVDNRGLGGIGLNRSSYQQNKIIGDPNETVSHELRWASSSDGPLTWLVGGNYYKNTWDRISQVVQVMDLSDPDNEATYNAPLFGEYNKGDVTNYGIFTEETFELTDAMRITAGLRYDKTKINNYAGQDFNVNLGPFMVAYNPPEMIHNPTDATYVEDSPTFDNWTYKLRFEYDLTPDNMLYALTSTGFLPGNSQINVSPMFTPPPDMAFAGVQFVYLPYDQEKLTSYEVGSKNRFLNNRLQLNASAFYYDYEGYQESINKNPPGSPPPPSFVVVRVPVRMYGLEVDSTWLITPNDKVTFSAGWLDAQLKSYPNLPGTDPPVSAKEYMYLKRVPGLPEFTANLGYDHTFLLRNGSSLVPRAELRYTGDYYLGQATAAEAASTDAAGNSYLEYLHQDAVALLNLGLTWSSPQDMYAVTGYLRNATDEEYKVGATLPTGTALTNVEVGDPRTWGIMVSVRF